MSKIKTILGGWQVLLLFSAILIVGAWLVARELFFTPPSAANNLVATWQDGSADRETYDSWLRFSEMLDSPSAIKGLVLITHLAGEAKNLGLDREPEVKIEIEAFRHRILTTALRNHLIATVSVSPEEIAKLQREHPDAFQKPRKLKLRNIYLPLGEDAGDVAETRQRIAAIRAEILAGADFGSVATRESKSQTRFSGGRLPLLDPSTLPEPVEAAVTGLGEGEISEVVEDSGGVSIYLCEKVQAAAHPNPDEVARKLRTNLTRLRQKQLWQDYSTGVFEEIEISKLDDSQVGVAECNGYRLSVAELDALVIMTGKEKGRDPAKITPGQIDKILGNWCMGVLMERRALDLALDRDRETAEQLRWGIARILASHALASKVRERLQPPTPADVKSFFDANRKNYQHQAEYRIGAIFFGPADQDVATLLNRAETVYRQIKQGTLSFGEAAGKFSRHASSKNGGDLGWLSTVALARLGQNLARAVRQMKPGQDTGIFRLESGIWLFELRDYRPPRAMTFEEAEPRANMDATNDRAHSLEESVREELFQTLSVKIPGESGAE